MKIALIGADGQLGTDIYNLFTMKGLNISGLTIEEIDICNEEICRSVLYGLKPDIIINTAAFNLVDECEDEIKKAFDVNVYGVKRLACICSEINATLMHFSTDYVFGGYVKTTPYTEDDCPSPVNVYGISKLAGEYIIKYMLTNYYIVRISGLYGYKCSLGKGYNFVDLMMDKAKKHSEVSVVDDQTLTPTSTKDVAEKLLELIETKKYGIYHMTNTGSCSWYEFVKEIFKIANINKVVKPVKSVDFKTKARRPGYSVLDNKRLRETGLQDMRHWKDALRDYIENKNFSK